MQIPVPEAIASAALGGNTGVLTEVSDAYKALKAAQEKAHQALQPEVAQVLADGLARSKATNGESARMTITEDGNLVVVLGDSHVASPAPVSPPAPEAPPAPAQKATNKPAPYDPRAFPPIGELRQRAAAVGVDIADLPPQAKDKILARIEAAEQAKAAQPAAPEPEAAKPAAPESEETEDDLGLDVAPEEPVESPANDQNVEPVKPPADSDVDVDNWLES